MTATRIKSMANALLLGLLAAASAASAAPTGQNVVIGYYYLNPAQINGYTENDARLIPFPISKITDTRARQLTHINFSFLDINAEGECAFDPAVNTGKAREVIARLGALRGANPQLRIMYSVGGWNYSSDSGTSVRNYREAVGTGPAREKLARSCIKIMKDFGFDGIDIDWEYPRPEDAENYVGLLTEIRRLLAIENAHRGKKAYHLTIAGAASAGVISRYYTHLSALAEPLDYINLMSYDLAGPWEKLTNHHAALYGDPRGPMVFNALRAASVNPALGTNAISHPSPFALTVNAAVKQYLIGGVPAGKLVMGVPFYGRAFRDVSSANNGQYSVHGTPGEDPYAGDPTWLLGCRQCVAEKEPRVATFADLKTMLAEGNGYVRHFNELTKTPYLHHPVQKLFVTYDDSESFKYKAKYIKTERLGGVMFWHLGQDDGDGSLLNSLHAYLNDPAYDDSRVSLGEGRVYRVDDGRDRDKVLSSENSATQPNSQRIEPVAWSESTVYPQAGLRVTFQGAEFESKWWTQGDIPNSADRYGAWKLLGIGANENQGSVQVDGNRVSPR